MDWAAVWRYIAGGLLIAGAIDAWIPKEWLRAFFFEGNDLLAALWGPIIGPVVALLSFVCSVGNVPIAAVLWNGGISFGGVASFIFADLIVLPIILIYRKYYGTKAALRITGTFYLAMVLAGYAVEVIFAATGLTPHTRNAIVAEAGISWNYTTWLNIAFHALALLLVTRFLLNGGARMLKMMGGSPDTHEHAGHNAHEHAVSDHGHEHGGAHDGHQH
ncbi:conserved hypothetical protein [Arthrobacter sp. Hiyo1]|uniref:permease n=1 Tax=Arthrobacter sp. Hiyo1 TaxID=1588020 RepID=UPI0006A34255|nr:permease [Arthrobacter sp. Hiyo1]GAP60729.1 conserved hypothetical protein [Arthrobacter sp. Hiyo1]